MMQILVHLFVAAGSLALCCAEDILCSATQGPRWTLYSVPEFQGTGCTYSWTNGTGYVLANQKAMIGDRVLNRSIRTLVTHTCFNQVNYTRDCISERIQCTASCLTDCRPELVKGEGMPRHHWSTIYSIPMVLMVLIRLGIF